MPEVRVDSIAGGGDGVGRLDGLAVFIPRTSPGELVEAAIRQKGRLARGRLLRVIEPSPDRVAPRCRHYDGDHCGGCQLQHLTMEAQLRAKQRIVQDAFSRIARREVPLPPIERSPAEWGYRSRLTLAMRWRQGAWVMGLHAHDEVDRVFDLRVCPITNPAVVDAWNEVKRAARWLPRAPELRGTIRSLGGEMTLVIEGGDAWPAAREFAAAVTGLQVIRWHSPDGHTRVIVDRRLAPMPDESFDQVNQPVATAARGELIERTLGASPHTVVDAYAGLGATSRVLASHGIHVTAIEADHAAVRYASSHLPEGSRAIAGRVEEVLGRCLPADVVILNPPRAGVDARVTTALNSSQTRRVLYMSCDPATLARDILRMPAYRVSSLRAYDMFPQTAHVEVVCELIPEGS